MPILGTIASSYRLPVVTSGYVALATTTLGAATNTVTFSSIPSGYEALEIRMSVRGTSSRARVAFRFNGDSGNNYYQMYGVGTGSSSNGGADYGSSFNELAIIPDSSAQSGATALVLAAIIDYDSTTKKKTTITHYAAPTNSSTMIIGGNACMWNNNNAITSILVQGGFVGSGDFEAGCTFSLYGVK